MTEIRIPQASMEMTDGAIETWLVDDGTTVEAGQPIYALETDKVVMEVVSPASGVIRVIGEQGVTYQVGEVIGHVE
jgi:pyruvate/2-oxoglutarate dehydrogenase complex dihydrolipoamide acyltransferase (E2) component